MPDSQQPTRPTIDQVRTLERFGVAVPDGCTYSEAGRLVVQARLDFAQAAISFCAGFTIRQLQDYGPNGLLAMREQLRGEQVVETVRPSLTVRHVCPRCRKVVSATNGLTDCCQRPVYDERPRVAVVE